MKSNSIEVLLKSYNIGLLQCPTHDIVAKTHGIKKVEYLERQTTKGKQLGHLINLTDLPLPTWDHLKNCLEIFKFKHAAEKIPLTLELHLNLITVSISTVYECRHSLSVQVAPLGGGDGK